MSSDCELLIYDMEKQMKNIQTSGTLNTFHHMVKLRSMGKDIINFCVGEPDTDTAPVVREFAIQAVKTFKIGYTPSEGLPELREAVSGLFANENCGLDPYKEIMITAGAKPALYLSLMTLLKAGDEVLIPEPYYPSYPSMVSLSGARPIFIRGPLEKGFKISVQVIEKYVCRKTRILIMNSPVNPTGSVYSESELREILDYCSLKNILCIFDDVYNHFIYNPDLKFFTSSLFSKYRKHLILIRSFSKEFAMTGWRIGYMAGDSDYITPIKVLQGHASGNPQTLSQFAALTALKNYESARIPLTLFSERRLLILDKLNECKNLTFIRPQGAFYFFCDIRNIKRYMKSDELSMYLMEDHGVAVTPGKAFGMEGFIRLSYADGNRLNEGMERLINGLNNL